MMSNISQPIPNLLGGISTQPIYLRGLSQAEDQINAWPLVSKGLVKRPPTEYVAPISPALSTSPFMDLIQFKDQAYVLLVDQGELFLLDTDGTPQTVVFPKGKEYLRGTDFKTLILEGLTYILNKDVSVKMDPLKDPARPFEALVFIKQAVAATPYELFLEIGGATYHAKITTANQERSTANIALRLKNDLIAKTQGLPLQIDLEGSTFRIRANQDFKIRAKDGHGDQASIALKGTTQNFSDLPARGFDDFLIEIAKDPKTQNESYYVQYQDGLWRETCKGGLANSLDSKTLPHALIPQNDGSFSFEPLLWDKRLVGDANTAPAPSFLGQKIQDLFFYQERLGFLAGNDVIFSETEELHNFWPRTTSTVLESDPLDLTLHHTKPFCLQNTRALPNGALLLIGNTVQFLLDPEGPLSARSLKVHPISFHEVQPLAPVTMQQKLVFANASGHIEESSFYISETGSIQTAKLTDHVEGLLPLSLDQWVAFEDLETLIAFSKKVPQTLYVHQSAHKGERRVQSAWGKWVFSTPLLGIACYKNVLYLLVKDSKGVHLEKLDLRNPVDAYLDRQKTFKKGIYNALTKRTSWDLQSHLQKPRILLASSRQLLFPLTAEGAIKGEGDLSKETVVIGCLYSFSYRFSEFKVKVQGDKGTETPITGKLILRDLRVTFNETGPFEVHLLKDGANHGHLLHEPLGHGSGTFRIPIYGGSNDFRITLKSRSIEPVAFQNALWVGRVSPFA